MIHSLWFWLALVICSGIVGGIGYFLHAILTASKIAELEAQIDALQRRTDAELHPI